MYDPYANFSKTVLDNGLELYSSSVDRSWIALEVVVHAGGREDPVDSPGLAHFVEHLVSKNIYGWEKKQAQDFFDFCGGSVSFGTTSYLGTTYKFFIPCDKEILRKALVIFGRMLLGSTLRNDIEVERQVIRNEYNRLYPYPEKLDWEMNMHKNLFRTHRVETWNRPLGRPEGFLATNPSQLQDFYNRYYVPRNMSLVVMGGISSDEVIDEVKKSPLGASLPGERRPRPSKAFVPLVPETNSQLIKISDLTSLGFTQSDYVFSWAIRGDFPRPAIRIFSIMLDGVLYRELRERRGLIYSTRSDYDEYQDVCEFEITGSMKPSGISVINEIVRECIDSIARDQGSFEDNKRSMILAQQMNDSSGRKIVDICAEDLLREEKIVSLGEEMQRYRDVGFHHMQDLAKLLSSERQYIFMTYP